MKGSNVNSIIIFNRLNEVLLKIREPELKNSSIFDEYEVLPRDYGSKDE